MSRARQLDLVRQFIGQGIRVYPAREKKPCIEGWNNGEATTSREQVEKWIQAFGDINFGAVCGSISGIFVIDIDVKGDEDGMSEWIDFVTGIDASEWSNTYTVVTPSGGRHIYYQWPEIFGEEFTNIPGFLHSVEARGNRHGVLLPGSRCSHGREYTVEKDMPIADAPKLIVERISSFILEKGISKSEPNFGRTLIEGARNTGLASMAGTYRRRGMDRDEILTNLRVDNRDRCVPPLPDDEIISIAKSIANYPIPDLERFSDAANGKRFAELAQDRAIFLYPRNYWALFNETHWEEDRIGAINTMAQEVTQELLSHAAEQQDAEERRRITKGAVDLEKRHNLASMLDMAKPALAVLPEKLDEHPLLLNTPSGVLDLEHRKLLKSDAKLLLTRCTPINWEKDAHCERWLTHLDTVFMGDMDSIAYFQKACGYTLTSSIQEQVFFYVWGPSFTGKTATLDVVSSVLGIGQYSMKAPIELFLSSKHQDHPAALHALAGARMIVAEEPSKGTRWNEGRMKMLSGEQRFSARRMYGNPEQMRITGKMWFSANSKPTIEDSTNAFWRRIIVIPFENIIPNEDRVMSIQNKLVADEGPGILAWMVRGCELWQQEGLKKTRRMVEEVAAYKSDMDVFSEFITDHIVVDTGSSVAARQLYNCYREWAEKAGMRALGNRRFPEEMVAHAFRRVRRNNGNFWLGIRLRTESDGQ
jgi:putative DNA primase/helicase